MTGKIIRLLFSSLICIGIGAYLSACTGSSQGGVGAGQGGAKPYPVKKLAYERITRNQQFPGTVEGVQIVELRPRVEGYLEKIYVDEGASVKKGQPLFKINAAEYQQQVNSARANVAVAKAQVKSANMEVEKQKPLVKKGIVGEFALTSAEYNLASAEASLQQAQANLDNALTNLGYTMVNSPADGIIGIFPYRIGSLVNSSISEPLTVISDISEVRVYFAVNEKDYISMSKALAKDNFTKQVRLILPDGTYFDHTGVIDAVSGIINKETGSATLRATFKNPDFLLHSGGSATVVIPNEIDSAIVVPQAATYEIQDRRFIYVVDGENTVSTREIEAISDDSGQRFIVTNGLKAGETVVVEGINSLKASMKIKPVQESGKEQG